MADETTITVTFTPLGVKEIDFKSLKYVDVQKLADVYSNLLKAFQVALERENRKVLLAQHAADRKQREMSDEEVRNNEMAKFLSKLNTLETANG